MHANIHKIVDWTFKKHGQHKKPYSTILGEVWFFHMLSFTLDFHLSFKSFPTLTRTTAF